MNNFIHFKTTHFSLETFVTPQFHFAISALNLSDLYSAIVATLPGSENIPPGIFNDQQVDFNFPIFSANEQRQVLKDLQKQGDKNEILLDHGYKPAFNEKALDKIYEEFDNLQNYLPFIISYVLNSSVSWMILYQKSGDISKLPSVLRLLPLLARDHVQAASTAFIRLFEYYLSILPLQDFQVYLDILRDYYTCGIEDLSYQSYHILVDCIKAVRKSIQGGCDICTDSLFVVIGILCEEHKSTFPLDIAVVITTIMSPSLAQLDISSLSLFSHLAPLLTADFLEEILQLIAKSIIKFINAQTNQIQFPKIEGEKKELYPPVSFKEVAFQSTQANTFPEGLNLRQNYKLKPKRNFEELISNDTHVRFSILLIPLGLNKTFTKLFLEPILSYIRENPDADNIAMMCITAIFFATHKDVEDDSVFECMEKTAVFDNRISCFEDSEEDYTAVDCIRNAIVELVIKGKVYSSPSILAIARSPSLFVEFVHRIIRDLEMVTYDNITTLVWFIMTTSVYYQDIDFESPSEEIETARTAILLLISHLLSQEGAAEKFYGNTYFVTFYMSLVFEDALRDMVLTSFKTYMSNPKLPITQEMMDILLHSLNVCFTNFQCDTYLKITYDTLQILNEVLKHNRSATEAFENLKSSFMPSMSKLSTSDLSQKVLLQYIQFFALTSSFKLLDTAQLSELETCVDKVFEHQLPQELSNKLIQLIATDIVPSLNPSFFIRQPDAVKLFLSIAMKTDKCIEVIDYIRSLIKYSTKNAIACHKYDVDIYILDTLKEIREDENAEQTQALLSLFQAISMEVSSSAVVQRFISLFAPINGKYIPPHQELYMNSLNQIISTSLKLPISYILLSKESTYITINGLTSNMLNDGFSICFWAYIDSTLAQYKPLICQLTDSHGKKLVWYFSGASLFCTQRGSNWESTGRVEMDDIPTHQWHFFIITYKTDQYMSTMQTAINCRIVEPLEFNPMKFHEGPIQCKIGGVLPDSSDSDRYSRIGSFAIFPALSNDVSGALYECGPRALGDLPATPISYFVISEDNCKVGVQVISKRQEVSISLSNMNIKSPITFLGALVLLCKVETLLPLFAQFDMKTKLGLQPKNFAKEVLECFGNLFAMSITAQQSFHWGTGFAIISHLMLSVSRVNITYSLYKQFFQMMQSITFPFLLDEIFQEILLNIDIWSRCDPEGHILVLRHWARNLVPSYSSIVAKIFPFKRALSILRLYYWYKPTESPQILGLETRLSDKDKFNLTEARRLLQSVALMISTYRFELDDFLHLQSHCITCCDDEQVADILWMLLQLGLTDPSPLASIQADFTSFIFTVLTRNNAKILRFALYIFVAFARKGFTTQQTLEEQLLFVIHIVQPSIMTPRLLDKIIEIIQEGYHELIPIAFVVARQAECLDTLLEAIKPSPEVATGLSYALLPMFVTTMANEETSEKILDFYAQCTPNCWETIFDTLDFIGNVLNEDLTKEKRMFIRIIAKYAEQDEKSTANYLRLARFFIFFRDRREPSDYLNSVYKSSCFYVQAPPRSPSITVDHVTRDSSFQDLRIGLVRTMSESHFGKLLPQEKVVEFNKLRIKGQNKMMASDFIDKAIKNVIPTSVFINRMNINSKEEWIDADIALNCIKMFDKHPMPEFLSTFILICSFLVYTYPEEVLKCIQEMKIKEEDRVANNSLIFLLSYHLQKCNLNPIPGYSTEKSPEQHFVATQKIQIHSDTEIMNNISQMNKKLNVFITENSKNMAGVLMEPSDELIQKSLASVGSVIDDIKYHRKKNRRRWMTLWRYLAVDRAPWNYIPADQAHFKRDNTACALFCPFKLKRNLNFDPHRKVKQRRVSTVVNPLLEMTIPMEIDNQEVQAVDPYDPVYYEYNCTVLAPHQERTAQFLITKKHIKLIFAEKKKFYHYRDIIHIFFRRRDHKPNSIEIFLCTGKSYFICFPGHNSLDILAKLADIPMPNIKTLQTRDFFSFFQQSKMTERWLNHRVSNFEYIMHLNIMSGRTFSDLSQYPIFPWVTTNFIERFIDFKNQENFRDLSKPIGALGEERLKGLIERIPELQNSGEEPYLFSSGPSCLIGVCMFLLRLEPFATMHIAIQKGEFDHPGRLFSSLYDTYQQVCHNDNDFRELIPEFFFMPEFLVNHNGFELGSTERVGKIGDVLLPPWCKNPMDFVYMHRKMLESPLVTKSLNKWIDLVWGVNQRGEGAKEANNVFRPEMYDSIWKTKHNSQEIAKIENILQCVGQIPPILFKEPHPQRTPELETRLIFSSPCKVVAQCNDNILLARIDIGGNMKLKVGMFEPSGLFIWCKIDVSQQVTTAPTKCMLPKRSSTSPHNRIIPGSLPARMGRMTPATFGSSGDRRAMRPSRIPQNETIELIEIDSENVQMNTKHIRDISKLNLKNTASTMTTLASRFAAISEKTGRVVLIDTKTGQIEELVALHNDAICLASDRDILAIAMQDSAVCVFKDPDFTKPIRVMPSYRDSIICCGVSASFYLVVLGTRDGSIIVNSLNKGGTVRVVDLENCRPRLVTITHGWGFIVVYMTKMVEGSEQHYLSVFNVNGELIKSVHIDNGIVAWDTWVSASGFDYLVFADTRGRIYAFEVYYANPGPCFFKCWDSVVTVKYLRDVSTVVAVTSVGKVLFVPHDIK